MATVRTKTKKAAAKKSTGSRTRRPSSAAATPLSAALGAGALSTAEAATESGDALSKAQMTKAQRDTATDWFAAARESLGKRKSDTDTAIEGEPTGTRKTKLMQVSGQLLRDQQTLDRREEAFFAEGSTETMRPPSADDIDRTRKLAEALGEAIANQKTAEAIVALADDLSELVLKVSKPGG